MSGRPNLSAPAPRLPDGKPDLSGIWNPPAGYIRDLARDLKGDVPFQPWAKAVYDERASGALWKEEPDANCLPQGVPKVLLAPAPWRIIQTPGIVFFVHEAFNVWWQAFVDGREFAAHPDVTSIARASCGTGGWSGCTAAATGTGDGTTPADASLRKAPRRTCSASALIRGSGATPSSAS